MNNTESHSVQPLRPFEESDYNGHHAAPLLVIGGNNFGASKRHRQRQDELVAQFEASVRHELEPVAKEGVVDFVARAITSRMHERAALSSMSYRHRLNRFPDFGAVDAPIFETSTACWKSLHGESDVRQNDLARRAFGMATAEYGSLTSIAAFRQSEEQELWDEVSELTGIDATPQAGDPYRLEVMAFDRDVRKHNHIGAARIGYRRYIGKLDDGTHVKARSSFIVNMRPSKLDSSLGLDSDLIDQIRCAENPTSVLAQIPEFQVAVKNIITAGFPSDIVLARNDTVYGHNKATEILVREASARRHVQS